MVLLLHLGVHFMFKSKHGKSGVIRMAPNKVLVLDDLNRELIW